MRRCTKKIEHPDNAFFGYQYAAPINNGAMEFGFIQPTTNPVYSYRGAGRLAGAMRPFTPASRVTHPAVTQADMFVRAGSLQLQPLIDSLDGGE